MKTYLFLIIFVIMASFSGGAVVAAKKGNDIPIILQSGDRPALSMNEAIHAAQSYLHEQKIDPEKNGQYLMAAIFHPFKSEQDERHWEIIWQVPNAKGGTTWVDVYETGKVQLRFGE